ncbi:MAG: MBOAT family protein [Butyrivibrio sp.]|nr:MBOAT family protein [Butyrivibrio sp.]
MSYHLIAYFAVFLPAVILVYQLVPQRFRFAVLLAADCIFFWLISGKLIVYLIAAVFATYGIGRWLDSPKVSEGADAKTVLKRKRRILALGVVANLCLLAVLKYTNFVCGNAAWLLGKFGGQVSFKPIRFMVPIGISFYTLQIISYLTDVYRGKQRAETNPAKIALYLSFFPQIMEGPIARYHETADDLYAGRGIRFENLKFGYQRIVWGLFKKIVVADRLYYCVGYIFENYQSLDGSIALMGAIAYTGQLYTEFSGCMDIIIGSGEIFGINLPENFRQPFAAKSASEFWRRWHITLGTFFKDYIFYPISLAKPVKKFAKRVKEKFGRGVSKFAAPTAALGCVWICNGLWHGANWTFIFYGVYYLVIIFIENITEEPMTRLADKLRINRQSRVYRALQSVKLFVIVIIGEMFFRSETLAGGFAMLKKILTDFHISECFGNIFNLKLDEYELIIALVGLLAVLAVGILHEKGIRIRERISAWRIPARWGFWYAAILLVMFFGAYGSGYTVVDLIYAGY